MVKLVTKNSWRISCIVITFILILIIYFVRVDRAVELHGTAQACAVSSSTNPTPIVEIPHQSSVVTISRVDQFSVRENNYNSPRSEYEVTMLAKLVRFKVVNITGFKEVRFSSSSGIVHMALNSSAVAGEIQLDSLTFVKAQDLNSDKIWSSRKRVDVETLHFTATPLIDYPALSFRFQNTDQIVITNLSAAAFNFDGFDLGNYRTSALNVRFGSTEINTVDEYDVKFRIVKKLQINSTGSSVHFSVTGVAERFIFNGEDYRESIFDKYFTNSLMLLAGFLAEIFVFLFPDIVQFLKSRLNL